MDENTSLISRKSLIVEARHTGLIVVSYFSYLFFGAFIFIWLEREREEKTKIWIQERKDEYLRDKPSTSQDELENLLEEIMNLGVSPLKRDQASPSWTIGQSFLFTVTISNTIGYGHVSPLTTEGIVFCMLFALVGIPASIAFISTLAQWIYPPISLLLSRILRNCKYSKVYFHFIKFL